MRNKIFKSQYTLRENCLNWRGGHHHQRAQKQKRNNKESIRHQDSKSNVNNNPKKVAT